MLGISEKRLKEMEKRINEKINYRIKETTVIQSSDKW
jgi:hypothetical protein